MDNKIAISLVIISMLALFVLAGCSSQQTQVPVPQPSVQENQPPAGGENQNPVIVVPEGGQQPPATTPPAEPAATPPNQEPSVPEPQPQTPPATAPAEETTPRLGVDLPATPPVNQARFIVEIPKNTPENSIIYFETYDVVNSKWRMFPMEKDEYLGWTIQLDLTASGGVEGDSFHYRYSRDGLGYATAERFAWDMSNAYRTRALSEIAGKDVPDKVTEWRDTS